MKDTILQDIREIAKKDFASVQASITAKQEGVTASLDEIKISTKGDAVTATCSFLVRDKEIIDASIGYESTSEGIFADSEINEVSAAILSAVAEPIMAAEDDPDDAFDFDAFDEEEIDMVGPDEGEVEEDSEELTETEDDEFEEDPETEPNIETDNNIAGHYIVECDRCHGIFISALMESDQVVETITGICPLCEKESDQYVKWVVKPVEFQ